MNILVIEDDKKISDFIGTGLQQEGFSVLSVDNGIDGFHSLTERPYDVAIVDIMLPKFNGLELIRQIREMGILTPILVLSAKSSVDERIEGLEAGADDYLGKPFAFAELIARVQALIRRANAIADPQYLQAGDLSIDLVRRRAERGGVKIDLQPKDFRLLEYLVRNQGKIVSKTMILENVWGYDFDPSTNVVESRVSRLRDKVDRGCESSLITTVRGAGYTIDA